MPLLTVSCHSGYHTVAHLASHGAHVYMGARSKDKGTAAIKSIQESNPSAHVDLLLMDLADLASVVSAATEFLSRETSLHGLVNNAGIMATPFEMTKDGHEAQWQTNYLGHWVFTEHLRPIMLETSKTLPPGSVRIVNISSAGHLSAPKAGINFSDIALTDDQPLTRYGQSKLAQILHVKTLNKLYGPGSSTAQSGSGEIWVSTVHPGTVDTNLSASVDPSQMLKKMVPLLRMFGLLWPAEKASWSSLFCVAGSDMKAEQSGGYFDIFNRCLEPSWESDAAKNAQLAEKLHAWTVEVTKREGWVS